MDNLVDSVVIPSLFTTLGRLLISSTPADTEDHPLFAIKQAAEREGWYFKATIHDAARYDPDDFPPSRIALFKSETKDPVAWEREYEAKWVKDPTKTVIPEWSHAHERDVERDEFFQFYHKYAALDSGVTDKTAGILGYYDFKRAALIIEDEMVLQGEEVRTDRIAEGIKAREVALGYQSLHDRKSDEYKRLMPNEKVYRRVADNDNLILVQDLGALYDLDFFPTRKDDLDAQVNAVREWAKNGRILVAPKCKELVGCLRNGIWDKKREKLAKSKIYGHFDALMALVYLVRNVDTMTNPIPQYYGRNWATHPGVPVDAHRPQSQAEKMARLFNVKTDRDQARQDFVRGANGIS